MDPDIYSNINIFPKVRKYKQPHHARFHNKNNSAASLVHGLLAVTKIVELPIS